MKKLIWKVVILMRVVEINAVSYGSTGNIMFALSDALQKEGHKVLCTSGHTKVKCNRPEWFKTSGFICKGFHKLAATLTGYRGMFSVLPTIKLIFILKRFSPDIIHLHNLHGWYINLPILFHYLKKSKTRVIWTLHDCWSFTGQCPHFTIVKCNKWKTGCYDCPQIDVYPSSFVDRTKTMWRLKMKWFTGVEDMTIVTPSQWLANLVKKSFMKDYHVKVINNGIDLSIFKPTKGSFKEKYKIGNKYMILGVAFDWGKRKGLDVFVELSKRLDLEKYQIVLVGTNESVDMQLPKNIISVHRTQNQKELAEIYTAADLFVNPTREEVLGLVNIEALACGTPVVTFNTGGSPECIDDTCGSVIDCDNIDALEKEIIRISEENPFTMSNCLRRAKQFDQNDRFKEYIELYKNKGEN